MMHSYAGFSGIVQYNSDGCENACSSSQQTLFTKIYILAHMQWCGNGTDR